MSIGEICIRDVVIVKRKESISEAAKLMRSYHVGNVVVVEEKNGEVLPVGILTDRDIVIELVAKNVPLDSVFVEDVMSSDPLTVKEGCGIWESIQNMRIKGVRRLIVVNDNGGVVGITSIDDLLELLSEELAGLATVVTREQDRERHIRD